MKSLRLIIFPFCLMTGGLSVAWACAFDGTLREYLSAHFWLPFAKSARLSGRVPGKQLSTPFAGMQKAAGESPMARLRASYQGRSAEGGLAKALAAAQAAPNLTPREREEVELIDAKCDMRDGGVDGIEHWNRAKQKMTQFLRKAHTPEFLSEARGWLAHIHYRLGDQTAAGKIYLDEMSRADSNLSRQTLVNSLKLTYGYDGGPKLLQHLDEYFDTPEHAAFAIQLVTNPRWERGRSRSWEEGTSVVAAAPPYERIKSLLERNGKLFQSTKGAGILAILGMRTALHAGDPPAALRIAARVPANASTRNEPDFQWMLAAAHFLSRDFAGAERPLLSLFGSSRSSDSQKAAAAYALCGVYQKTSNPVEQIRFALWLESQQARFGAMNLSYPTVLEDLSVYWAMSGWDLNLLLEAEASIAALQSFLEKYPAVSDVQLVKYSLAVRLARENRYEESAQIYASVKAPRRAGRMRQLAALYRDAHPGEAPGSSPAAARFKLGEYVAANQERLYFNDVLWHGMQRYALVASEDSRLTRSERQRLTAAERKLKDDQEELWRAYSILRDVARESGKTALGRQSAQVAVRCLRQISERFGRQDEIRAADIELSAWLARSASPGN